MLTIHERGQGYTFLQIIRLIMTISQFEYIHVRENLGQVISSVIATHKCYKIHKPSPKQQKVESKT